MDISFGTHTGQVPRPVHHFVGSENVSGLIARGEFSQVDIWLLYRAMGLLRLRLMPVDLLLFINLTEFLTTLHRDYDICGPSCVSV
jgi:hypothetical protein